MTAPRAGWSASPRRASPAMFIMMNAARLGVGLQGLAQGEVAYQNAVTYAQRPPPGPRARTRRARGRRQGRSDHRPPRRPPHADGGARRGTRRARALVLWGALQVDLMPPVARRGGAPAGRRSARPAHAGHQGLSDRQGLRGRGQRASRCSAATATFASTGMEQFVRDARIAQIYEGTNGIQAMDLVGASCRRTAAGRSGPSSSWSATKSPRRRARRSGGRCGRAGVRWRSPGRNDLAGAERPPIRTMPELAPIPIWT